MKDKDICEALYALPAGAVTARRQPIFKPAMTMLAGAVLLIADICAVDSSRSGNLSAGLVLAGAALLLAGAVVTAIRLCGGARTPYYVPDGVYLRRRERFYGRNDLAALRKAVDSGDAAALDAVPESDVSALTLVEYYSPRSGMRAMRLYEYAEFDRRPLGGVKIVGLNR